MKNWNRKLALTAAAALMVSALAGCGSDAPAETTAPTTPVESASGLTIEKLCQDLMGVSADTVLATVNGEEVTAADAGYWLAYDLNMFSYYYGTSLDYDTDFNGAMTIGEYVISDGLNMAITYEVLEQKAAELGLTLSEEDLAQIKAESDAYKATFGEERWAAEVEAGTIVEADYTEEQRAEWIAAEGALEFEKQIAILCATEAQFDRMNQINMLYDKVLDHFYGENGVDAKNDEELMAWAEESGYLCSRSVLFGETTDAEGNTVDWADMTDDQKAALKAEAQAALDEILAAADPADAFAEVMVTNNDDPGLTAETDCYLYTAGTMVSEYEEAVKALAENEISAELVESADYGYFLVMRLPIGLDILTLDNVTIREMYPNEGMTAMMAKWLEEAETVNNDEAIGTLNMNNMFAAMLVLNEDLYPSTETTGEETPAETTTAE